MTWLHNVTKSHQGTAASCNKNLSQGKEILQKPEMQIFVSNQSLVLQKVSILLLLQGGGGEGEGGGGEGEGGEGDLHDIC